MADELWQLDVGGLRDLYRRRAASPTEVVQALAQRIETYDPSLGGFVNVTLDQAVEEAAERTSELQRDTIHGPLHGVPVAVKEIIDVAGVATSYGSAAVEPFAPQKDAESVARLRRAGAIVLGLTTSHEFAWGITTRHPNLGGSHNPWSTDRIAGGSSGGSAVAVAAGMAPLALGTDTGGSIRIPPALCGVCGLKPTWGRVTLAGVLPLAPSLDHLGVIARSAADLAGTLGVLAGPDPADPRTTFAMPPLGDLLSTEVTELRLGVAPDLRASAKPRADYAQVFDRAVAVAADLAREPVEVPLPEAEEMPATYGAYMAPEAHDVHARLLETFPDRAELMGADVRGRLEGAAGLLAADYLRARAAVVGYRRRFAKIFERVDVLLTPVTAGGPPTVAQPDWAEHDGEQVAWRDLALPYTVPQDLTGYPAAVVPAGFDRDGLPVGIQLTGGWGREGTVLRLARVLNAGLADRGPAWPPPSAPDPSGGRGVR